MSDEEDIEWEYEDESDAATRADTEQINTEDADDEFHYSHAAADDDGDDDGDVDWEDADQPTHAQETEAAVHDLNAVNWDHINSVLQREAERVAKPTPKRAVVRMTKEDKAHERAVHESHLLVLLAAQLRHNALCQSRVLRGVLLSMTSDSSRDFFVALETDPLPYTLELLVRWFQDHFQVVAHRDNSLTENALLGVVCDRKGSPAALALVFTTLCRALGLCARLAVAMDPIVVQQHSNAAEAAVTTARSNNTLQRGAKRPRQDEEVDERATPRTLWVWTEVLNPKTKTWIAVDAVRKVVNRPQEIAALRGKFLPLTYVVSVEDDGYLADVTPRYVERWSKTLPRRLAHDWFLRSLQLINSQLDPSDADAEVRTLEQTKLQQRTEAEDMPTSFEGFRKHHLYCLERFLGRLECVYPRKAVGLFKGHAVFLRSSVQTTRTWFQWRRLGRQVRESEKDRPAKRMGKETKKGNSDSDDDQENKGTGQALYGFWQTDEVVPPRVDGATVPKNSFGNIELWSPAHLPIGGVHLQLPRIDKVAQELGVDFAPAVVGFESRNGVNCPQFDGIVVAEVVAETLLDAHAHVQQSMIEKAIHKNQQLMAKRWERLVKRLLLKQRLNEEYGDV